MHAIFRAFENQNQIIHIFDPAAVVRTMRALADVESADRISQGTCFVRISYASMVSNEKIVPPHACYLVRRTIDS